jgi:hypothetical protein
LREREGDPLSEELSAAMKRIGEPTMENEGLMISHKFKVDELVDLKQLPAIDAPRDLLFHERL